MKKLAVVAPTFNEEENIAAFLKAVLAVQKKLSATRLEIVISDSHSTDGTAKIVQTLARRNKNIHYLDVQKRGLGLGISRGLDFAFDNLKADYAITLEADLSCDPTQIPQFAKVLEKADLVIGSRYVNGGKIKNWSLWRKILSKGANLVLRLLIWQPQIHEFTNLYRGMTREVWQKLRSRTAVYKDWLFLAEFVFASLQSGLKIKELPITYFDRFGGRSKMNTVGYTQDLMRSALRYRLKESASFFKFLVVGGIGFIINTAGLVVGVHFGLTPANAGAAGAELAIISNFILNNFWTFSDRKLVSWKVIPLKFIQFNVLSIGSVVIQYSSLKIGELIFGLSRYKSSIVDTPYLRIFTWYMLFYVIGVGLGLIWNYTMYSRVIWAKKNKNSKSRIS